MVNWEHKKTFVKEWGPLGTLVSAVVALIALCLSMQRLVAQQEEISVLEWQQFIVHSIVDDAGGNGIEFDQIHQKYLQEVQLADVAIPKTEIGVTALERVLFDLRKSHLISRDTKGKTQQLVLC
jgi:hypothetical protein